MAFELTAAQTVQANSRSSHCSGVGWVAVTTHHASRSRLTASGSWTSRPPSTDRTSSTGRPGGWAPSTRRFDFAVRVAIASSSYPGATTTSVKTGARAAAIEHAAAAVAGHACVGHEPGDDAHRHRGRSHEVVRGVQRDAEQRPAGTLPANQERVEGMVQRAQHEERRREEHVEDRSEDHGPSEARDARRRAQAVAPAEVQRRRHPPLGAAAATPTGCRAARNRSTASTGTSTS